jgi:nuclear mRNA export protein SAC3
MQFYDDNEGKLESPNEGEFRSYYILAHIRDTNSMRRLQALPRHIFLDPVLQTALEFRSYAQRNTYLEKRSSSHRAAKLKFRNSEACLNAFTRFFKRVQNVGTSYLMACLLEYHFGGVRKGAIHALWRAYITRHRPLPTRDLMEMLGMDNEEKTGEVAQHFGIIVVEDADESGTTTTVQLNRNSKFERE